MLSPNKEPKKARQNTDKLDRDRKSPASYAVKS
jgi:hypothetical protein